MEFNKENYKRIRRLDVKDFRFNDSVSISELITKVQEWQKEYGEEVYLEAEYQYEYYDYYLWIPYTREELKENQKKKEAINKKKRENLRDKKLKKIEELKEELTQLEKYT